MRMFMNKIKKSDEMFDLYYFILQQQMRSKFVSSSHNDRTSSELMTYVE